MVENSDHALKEDPTEKQDQMLLVAIYASKANIDWDWVGKHVERDITGAATIQHIAKIRLKFEKLGIPVPPLSKSGRSEASSSAPMQGRSLSNWSTEDPINSVVPKKRKLSLAQGLAASNSKTAYKPPQGRRGVAKKNVNKDDWSGSEDDQESDYGASDGDYGVSGPRSRSREQSDDDMSDGFNENNKGIQKFMAQTGKKRNCPVREDLRNKTLIREADDGLNVRGRPLSVNTPKYIKPELDYVTENVNEKNPMGKSLLVRLSISPTMASEVASLDSNNVGLYDGQSYPDFPGGSHIATVTPVSSYAPSMEPPVTFNGIFSPQRPSVLGVSSTSGRRADSGFIRKPVEDCYPYNQFQHTNLFDPLGLGMFDCASSGAGPHHPSLQEDNLPLPTLGGSESVKVKIEEAADQMLTNSKEETRDYGVDPDIPVLGGDVAQFDELYDSWVDEAGDQSGWSIENSQST
ncbi:MAG: hypothetical protein M1814_000060 [Vezdaea aestivalis]|nr:MAG: hypothetical protein M1814_000060 [Vezdaea aestivalis]